MRRSMIFIEYFKTIIKKSGEFHTAKQKKKNCMKRELYLLLTAMFFTLGVKGNNYVPLKVGGFNDNIIITDTTDLSSKGTIDDKTTFFASSIRGEGSLPAFLHTPEGIVFELSATNENNALNLNSKTGKPSAGTLTFQEPVKTEELWMLCTASGNSVNVKVTVFYEDGTSKSSYVPIEDWYLASPKQASIWGLSRLNKETKSISNNFAVYAKKIAVDPSKRITSLNISRTSGECAAILAISAKGSPLISRIPSNGIGQQTVSIHSFSGQSNETNNVHNLLLADNTKKWTDNQSDKPWVIFDLTDVYSLDRLVFKDAKSQETTGNNVPEFWFYTSEGDINTWNETYHGQNKDNENIKDILFSVPIPAKYVKVVFNKSAGGDINIYGLDLFGVLKKRIDKNGLISVGKRIIAFDNAVSGVTTPINLLDGNNSTGVSSWNFTVPSAGNSRYVVIDLGRDYSVDKFKLYDAKSISSSGNNISGYTIYSSTVAPDLNLINPALDSNGTLWTKIAETNNSQEVAIKENNLAQPVKARYIKLEIPASQINSSGRIYAFEIYGTVYDGLITPEGKVLKISNLANAKTVSTQNSSLRRDNIVQYKDAASNSQRWKITETEDNNYVITNLSTGLPLTMPGQPAEPIALTQDSLDILRRGLLWNISLVPNYTDRYYITNASLLGGTTPLYLCSSSNTEGAYLTVQTKPNGVNNAYIWKLSEEDETEEAPNDVTRDNAFNKWKTMFYKKENTGYSISGDRGWGGAEMMEMILDGYETTGEEKYKEMYDQLFSYFRTAFNAEGNWMNNDFNDDIAWMTIGCVRAYRMFGTKDYLDIAKFHFDAMYKRALLPSGALRWKENTNDGTTSCVNCPSIIAACYLAQALGDDSYYEKAKDIYVFQREKLYDPNNGQVFDTEGNRWAGTYNLGTFIGAALMLREKYGDIPYLQDAIKTANYTRGDKYNFNVINDEGNGNDLPGFKGILMRYLRKYIVDLNVAEYLPWMHLNAKVAYNNRNANGLIDTRWGSKTIDTQSVGAWGTYNAVSLLINVPSYADLSKDAYRDIEAESFNYISGPYVVNAPTGSKCLSNIKNDNYVGFMNIDFSGNPANYAHFSVSNADAENARIEIHQDNQNGLLLGTVNIPKTGSLDAYQTVETNVTSVSGLNNIYLVFKTDGQPFNVDKFSFTTTPVSSINKNMETAPRFSVYPSVVNKNEIINSSLLTGKATFISLQGIEVTKQTVESGKITTAGLQSGVYLLKLDNAGKSYYEKIIIR